MIPVGNTLKVTDDLPGKKIAFTIGDPRWVMRSMADLYSDRETALTREYSTNAHDEHVKYGIKRPIEVTLPSLMNSNFQVRDYGIGMSPEVLETVYTEFGTSTKQASNDFNGMLGFGSKSAVAYTDTFLVESIYGGYKSEATIHRNADYGIEMTLLPPYPTDEPSGTLVTIPVHNWQEFAHKAKNFYKFWRPGQVLINGQEPESGLGEQLTDNLYLSDDEHERSFVVMGNVAYPIENPRALFYNRSMNAVPFVAYVDNGLVEFTPNREALKYTEHTINTLQKVVIDFEQEMETKAKAEIANAVSHFEAYVAWSKWRSILGYQLFGDLSFKGDALVNDFKIKGTLYRPDHYGYSTRSVETYPVDNARKTLIVTNYHNTLSSVHKAKVREYKTQEGLDVKHYIFTEQADVKSPWIDPSLVIDWETLKAALPVKVRRVPQGQSGPKRVKGTFDYWTDKGWVSEKPLPTTGDVYYITVQRAKEVAVYRALELLKWTDAAVVVLASNRINKFRRENPQVREFVTYATTFVIKDGVKLLTDEAKEALAVDYTTANWLSLLNLDELDDPRWARLKALKSRESALCEAYENNLALASSLGMGYNGVKRHSISASKSLLVSEYPLLEDISYHGRRNTKHLALYMNAVYAAKKGN